MLSLDDYSKTWLLAADFRRWGIKATKRIEKLAKKHGVTCNTEWTQTKGKKWKG